MLQLEINKLTEETNVMNARIEVEDQMQTLRSFLGINREVNLRVIPDDEIPQLRDSHAGGTASGIQEQSRT